MTKEVILTGLRANNDLHLGNYLGALLPIVDMSKKHGGKYQVNLMMADLHSFSTPIDHSKFQQQIQENLRTYVAAGLPMDNADIRLFRESYVPAHSELMHILDAFTGVGEMNRMTQFKDKSSKLGTSRVSVALFNYPPLMAADILLYDANYVPVGDDQSQHLEFTRDIAERMNSKFGDLFVVPKPVSLQHKFFGKDQGLRIMNLLDPSKKMSKSDENDKGVIFLNDSPAIAKKKIMGATTDSIGRINFDRVSQPGLANLIEILAVMTDKTVQETSAQFEGQTQYGPIKSALADEIAKFLSDFQTEHANIDENQLFEKLKVSELEINAQANAKLLKVQKAVGLRA